jgi:hypothetical protein
MRNLNEIDSIRKSIEKMNKFHQTEILKILLDNKIEVNENNYGTFVNMTELEDTIIDKMINYMEYVNDQEIQLRNIEKEKGALKYKYFSTSTQESSEI